MNYPSRSWSTFPGVAVHWIETAVLTMAYLVARTVLGVDAGVNWTLGGEIMLLATLVLFLVWLYARPRRTDPTHVS